MVNLYPFAFRLPWHTVKSVIISGTVAGAAVLIMGAVVQQSGRSLLDNVPPALLSLACVLVAGLVWEALSKPWVFVNSTSFKGYNPSRILIRIYWHEPVTLVPIADKDFPCLGVQSEWNKTPLLIPLSIAKNRKFRATIEKCAPEDHPLRMWLAERAGGKPAAS